MSHCRRHPDGVIADIIPLPSYRAIFLKMASREPIMQTDHRLVRPKR